MSCHHSRHSVPRLFSVQVTVQTAFTFPACAVILHLPGFRAVTTPFFTLAILGLELFPVSYTHLTLPTKA